MSSINGIGTSFYGQCDFEPDGTYIATYWFMFIYVPLIPLYSARMHYIHTGQWSINTEYHFEKLPIHWGQVLRTWAFMGAYIGGIFLLALAGDIFGKKTEHIFSILISFYIIAMPMLPNYLCYRAKLNAGWHDAQLFSKETKRFAIIVSLLLIGFALFMFFIRT